MRHEAPQDREADHAAPFVPEGGVGTSGGRPDAGRPPVLHRLKRSVDCFTASDGTVYLLHDGLGLRFEVPDPTPSDHVVLEMLGSGFVSETEIRERLNSRGLEDASVATSLIELDAIGVTEKRDGPSRLSPQQAERYDRQLIYFADVCGPDDDADDLQARLSDAHVVILGCGGLGSWAACGLACAGIGKLTLIDDDSVETSNLNRQLLFRESDLGRPKVDAARDSLAAYNSEIELVTFRERVEGPERIAELIADSDLLVGTADWPPYELPRWINTASLDTGVPYLTAGQFPPLIRVGPTVIPGRTSCLECQEREARRDFPLYDELADFRSKQTATASTLGAASGMIGSMIAMEVIHLLTGASPPATLDATVLFDLRTMEATKEVVNRECDHAQALTYHG